MLKFVLENLVMATFLATQVLFVCYICVLLACQFHNNNKCKKKNDEK